MTDTTMDDTTYQRVAESLLDKTWARGRITLRDGTCLETDEQRAADSAENFDALDEEDPLTDVSTYWIITNDGVCDPIDNSSDLALVLAQMEYSLLEAVQYGQKEAVKILIEGGADTEACDRHGRTPIMFSRDPTITKILCEAGADVNAQDTEGLTALHHAAGPNFADSIFAGTITKILCEAGADATLVNRRGERAEDVARGEAKDILITERVERERGILRQVVGLNDTEEPVQRSRRM